MSESVLKAMNTRIGQIGGSVDIPMAGKKPSNFPTAGQNIHLTAFFYIIIRCGGEGESCKPNKRRND